MDSFTYSLENIGDAAKWLLSKRGGRNIITFSGDMGAGKTTLITEICRSLAVPDDISSPTFSIVNEYQGSEGPVYHFDFYRIKNIHEAYDFGYEEYFDSGNLCLVEWPEKINSLLPEDSMKVLIAVIDEGSRRLSVA